jgi:hypothetical protein
MHFRLPKNLHGWGDFGREVTIVVIGVLIAISLDQWVEHRHWVQKIDRAEGAMRLELTQDDGPQAFVRLAIAPYLDSSIGQLEAAADSAPAPRIRQMADSYQPPFRTWDAQGGAAVLASDVGSHMESDKLVQWSSPYLLISNMTAWNQRESELVINLREAVPAGVAPSPSQRQDLRREAAELGGLNVWLAGGSRLLLAAMDANGMHMTRSDEANLLSEAKARYGTCVRQPQPAGTLGLTQFSTEDQMRRFALGTP